MDITDLLDYVAPAVQPGTTKPPLRSPTYHGYCHLYNSEASMSTALQV